MKRLSLALVIGILSVLSSGLPTWTKPGATSANSCDVRMLQYHGGPVLETFTIYPLYYGDWEQKDIDDQQDYLVALAAYLSGENAPTGQQPMMRQYGVRSATVDRPDRPRRASPDAARGDCVPTATHRCDLTGDGTRPDPNVTTCPRPPSIEPLKPYDKHQNISNIILENQMNGNLPPYSRTKLIMVFLANYFDLYGCPNGCAYHERQPSSSFFAPMPWAVVPFSSPSGHNLQGFRLATAHEVLEAAADPAECNSGGWDEAVDGCDPSCSLFSFTFDLPSRKITIPIPGAHDNTQGGRCSTTGYTGTPPGSDLRITPWGEITGMGDTWKSPDIFVVDFLDHETDAFKGQVNRLRAHVRNLGLAPATGVVVRFKYAPWFTGISNDALKEIGTVSVNFAAAGAAGADKVVPIDWDLTNLTDTNGGRWPMPISAFEHFCVKVSVEFDSDTNPSDNNAQTNFFDVQTITNISSRRFMVGNPYIVPVTAQLILEPLPEGFKAELQDFPVGFGQNFLLHPQEIKVATVVFTPPPGLAQRLPKIDAVAQISLVVRPLTTIERGQETVGGISARLVKGISLSPSQKCSTICFRSPQYYLLHLDHLPRGTVIIGGFNNNTPVSTTNVTAIRLALQGGMGSPTALEQLNQELVAAQLSLDFMGGTSAPKVIDALWSTLGCAGLNFVPVTLSNNVTLSPDSMLKELFMQAYAAIRDHRTADMRVLVGMFDQLNGNDPSGRCY